MKFPGEAADQESYRTYWIGACGLEEPFTGTDRSVVFLSDLSSGEAGIFVNRLSAKEGQ